MKRIAEFYDLPEIKKLIGLKDHDEIIIELQKIMKRLLLETEIVINKDQNEVLVEPVCIEAYYNCPAFQDNFVHKNKDLQKEHYGKLYIHRGNKSKDKEGEPVLENRGGIDLCLSAGEYFLSFLLREAYVTMKGKTTFVGGPGRLVKFLSGQSIGGNDEEQKPSLTVITKENCSQIEKQSVLYFKDKKSTAPVYNTIRINLPYDRKAAGSEKEKSEKAKEKFVFALLGAVKGM